MDEHSRLLAADEAQPALVRPGAAAVPFLLLCDHAGRAVPRALADLGLPDSELSRHIGWDIGAGALTTLLSQRLGAAAVLQRYSRLVIDCNRRPGHPTSIAPVSDGTAIPGNASVTAAEAALRVRDIFAPYHEAIAGVLDARTQPTILVAMHSFTPVWGGAARPWEVGVLFERDPALSLRVAALLRAQGFCVGENEPYRLTADSDYSVPVHGWARGLPCLEIEVRQDLIADAAGQVAWAEILDGVLSRVC